MKNSLRYHRMVLSFALVSPIVALAEEAGTPDPADRPRLTVKHAHKRGVIKSGDGAIVPGVYDAKADAAGVARISAVESFCLPKLIAALAKAKAPVSPDVPCAGRLIYDFAAHTLATRPKVIQTQGLRLGIACRYPDPANPGYSAVHELNLGTVSLLRECLRPDGDAERLVSAIEAQGRNIVKQHKNFEDARERELRDERSAQEKNERDLKQRERQMGEAIRGAFGHRKDGDESDLVRGIEKKLPPTKTAPRDPSIAPQGPLGSEGAN